MGSLIRKGKFAVIVVALAGATFVVQQYGVDFFSAVGFSSPKKQACSTYSPLLSGKKPNQERAAVAKARLRSLSENIFETNKNLSMEKEVRQSSLISFAKDRKNMFVDLMQEDPLAAFDFMLSNEEYAAIADLTDGCVEKNVTLSGKLFFTHYHVDEELGVSGGSKDEYKLVTPDGQEFNAYIADSPHGDDNADSLAIGRGTEIRVRGLLIDNHFLFNTFEPNNFTVIGQSPSGDFISEANASQAPTVGTVKVAVIIANVSDASVSSDVSQVQSTMSQVADFYTENSYGQLNLQNSVFGPYTLPINKSECTLDRVRSEAIKIADPSIYYPDYGQIVIIIPSICPVSGAGVSGWITMTTDDGYIEKPASVISDMNTRTIAHEMGHSFGSGHATMLFCENGPAFAISETAGCQVVGYGDKYSVMDTNVGHFNVPEKSFFEWLGPTAIQDITVDGTYVIKPIETSGDGLKGVKIRRAANDYIYVEYRQPIGFDASLNTGGSDVFDGASIHTHAYGYTTGASSMLLNIEPESSLFNANLTVSLKPGETFTDPTNGTSITVVSKNSSALTLNVNAESPDIIIPTVSITSPVDQQEVSGIVTVIPNIAEDRAVQKVKYTIAGQTFIVTQAPYTLQWDTTTLTNGSKSMYAWIQDTSGNSSSSPTQVVTVNNAVTDFTPPTVTLTSPINGSSIISPALFSADASDNVGVDRVAFRVSGPLTFSSTDYSSPFTMNKDLTLGSYIMRARAFDAAGNVGESQAVSFTVVQSLPDTTPPTVSVTSPLAGEYVKGQLQVKATASDTQGVARVEFFKDTDSAPFAADTTSPFEATFDTLAVSDGQHTFKATAYDAAGNAASNSVTATVDNTPPSSATITSPLSGATVSGSVSVSASAADNVAVAQVDFYYDSGLLIGTDPTSPYNIAWNSLATANGSHVIYARAVDRAGNATQSANISVNVQNLIDTTQPTVSLTSPTSGSLVKVKSTVTLSASASDDTGVIKTEFYVNGKLECSDSVAPYSCAWVVPQGPGKTYSILAKAYDQRGNVGSSPAISVTSQR